MKIFKLLSIIAATAALLCSYGCEKDKNGKEEEKLYRITLTCANGAAEAWLYEGDYEDDEDYDEENWTIVTEAPEGSTIEINADPDVGYRFSQWKVAKGNVTFDYVEENWAEFKMPPEDVEIIAEFVVEEDVFTKIPDPAFRKYCELLDKDGDGKLYESEIDDVTHINLNGDEVSSVEGIEYFRFLSSLYVYNNRLTSLDVSSNTQLTSLYCANNQLTSLDLSKNTNLTTLDCSYNQLKSLNLSKNTQLKNLDCYNNQLKSLDLSKNSQLTTISFSSNMIETIKLDNLEQLATMVCWRNKLTSLDVSGNTQLKELRCDENAIERLDLSENTLLETLSCHNNKLIFLDVSKSTLLSNLFCANNNLTNLNVSKNTQLTALDCDNNKLTSLDISKNKSLTFLWCFGNENLLNITVWSDFDIDNPQNSIESINKDPQTIFVRVQ